MALSSLAVDASLFIITIHYLLFAVRYLLDTIYYSQFLSQHGLDYSSVIIYHLSRVIYRLSMGIQLVLFIAIIIPY